MVSIAKKFSKRYRFACYRSKENIRRKCFEISVEAAGVVLNWLLALIIMNNNPQNLISDSAIAHFSRELCGSDVAVVEGDQIFSVVEL